MKFNPMLGFNLEGKIVSTGGTEIESSSGAESNRMEQDLEERPSEDIDGKKRPRILSRASNIFVFLDPTGIMTSFHKLVINDYQQSSGGRSTGHNETFILECL